MKILFADNSLWAQLNFRGSIITHLRDVGHEVVMGIAYRCPKPRDSYS